MVRTDTLCLYTPACTRARTHVRCMSLWSCLCSACVFLRPSLRQSYVWARGCTASCPCAECATPPPLFLFQSLLHHSHTHTTHCMSPMAGESVRGSAAACCVMCVEQCVLDRADCVQESVRAVGSWREAVLRRRAASPGRLCPLVSQVILGAVCVCFAQNQDILASLCWSGLLGPAAFSCVCCVIYTIVAVPLGDRCFHGVVVLRARVCAGCVGADCRPIFFRLAVAHC